MTSTVFFLLTRVDARNATVSNPVDNAVTEKYLGDKEEHAENND